MLPKQHKSSARLRKEKGREEKKNHKLLMAPGITCIFISISLKNKHISNSICCKSKDYLTIRNSLNKGVMINPDCQYCRWILEFTRAYASDVSVRVISRNLLVGETHHHIFGTFQ